MTTQVPTFASASNVGNTAPRKKHFRQRAHCNPLNDGYYHVPVSPMETDWSAHYPTFFEGDGETTARPKIRFADVGCGFGGCSCECLGCFRTR